MDPLIAQSPNSENATWLERKTHFSFWEGLLLAIICVPSHTLAQDTSLKPGINKSFEDPDVEKRVQSFEGESREISQRRKEIVELCQLTPGLDVADVGAGTGLFTRPFAPEGRPQGDRLRSRHRRQVRRSHPRNVQGTGSRERERNRVQPRIDEVATRFSRRGLHLRHLPPLRIPLQDDGHGPQSSSAWWAA